MTAQAEYEDLPTVEGSDLRHAWQEFSIGDLLGSLNRLTPERVVQATKTIRTGEVLSLDIPMGRIDPPLFNRPPVTHEVVQTARNFFEDKLDNFYLQASTQWDGFGHIRFRDLGFWQGRTAEPQPGDALGVGAWAEHGVVGRGVLADVAAYRQSIGSPILQGTNDTISVDDLFGALEHQGTELRPGDILCVRTGWLEWYGELDEGGRTALAEAVVSPGLAGTAELAEALWNSQISALAADNPAIEQSPGDASLHKRLIPLLGFALGELFSLDELAAKCRANGHYDFLFVSVPLNIPGGLGSPANAIAIR